MSDTLKIGKGIELPCDAVTQTFGVLAVRGAGKSNLAACMAEEMHAAGLPFVAIDPVGSWSGLRSSADGKKPGLDIPVFGGRRGDLPLERGAGVLLADLVVDKRMSCVLDVSEFSEGDKTRAVVSIRVDAIQARVRLTREQAWQLGQTLILMTGEMRDSKAGA